MTDTFSSDAVPGILSFWNALYNLFPTFVWLLSDTFSTDAISGSFNNDPMPDASNTDAMSDTFIPIPPKSALNISISEMNF